MQFDSNPLADAWEASLAQVRGAVDFAAMLWEAVEPGGRTLILAVAILLTLVSTVVRIRRSESALSTVVMAAVTFLAVAGVGVGVAAFVPGAMHPGGFGR